MSVIREGIGGARIDASRAGRPLRFLAMTLGGWSLFRTVMLWPAIDTPGDLVEVLAPPLAAAELPASIRKAPVRQVPMIVAGTVPRSVPRTAPPLVVRVVVEPGEAASVQVEVPALPPPLATTVPAASSRAPFRWSGSAWAIGRGGGGGRNVLGGSQLGGSQAGARIAYALGTGRRAALVARFATPLEGAGREMGVGAEIRLRPGLRLIAEQRVALDGGQGGPSLFAVGGIGPTPIGGFRLEAYGQAGAVKRRRMEPFADGALRIARPVLSAGRVRLDLGGGAWGGAQRDAARFDLGPSIGAVLPLGERSLRLTLDWRQRVAGSARPGSGPALSAGMDF